MSHITQNTTAPSISKAKIAIVMTAPIEERESDGLSLLFADDVLSGGVERGDRGIEGVSAIELSVKVEGAEAGGGGN